MVRRLFPFVRQYESHRQLVARPRPGAGRRPVQLDAIVVPASRSAVYLDHAVNIARAVNCRLVVLCSRNAVAAEVSKRLVEKHFNRGLVVDLHTGYQHDLLDFTSSRVAHREMSENPNGDLSTKRNLGLLLARMLGWERIFFMDDDIRNLTLPKLYATVSMLGRYRSAAMRVTDFPDNSVVCHAHRETGATQDIFVSGSVLAVSCQTEIGFFPEIYNEDWLFFYDDARSRRLGWSGRNARQLHYDPFEGTRRAERQELGDVLAEGLYTLLDLGGGQEDAKQDYWKKFLVARRKFLEDIIERSDCAALDKQVKIYDAVQTAILRLTHIQPGTCENYLRAWRTDRSKWVENLKSVRPATTVQAALRELGLTATQGESFDRARHIPHELATLPLTTRAEIPDFQAETSSPSVWRPEQPVDAVPPPALVPAVQAYAPETIGC